MALVPLDPERHNNYWYSRGTHPTVMVFLHGIFSDSRNCWKNTSRTTSTYWPDLILRDQRLGNLSIYLAGYHTALDAGDFPVSQCAREVFDALRRPEANGTPPVLDSDQLIIVCHSTGGIVARYMLEKYRDSFEDKEVGLLLMASPSLGSGWANLGDLAAKYYRQRLARQLRWNNEELEDLHGRFKDLVDQRASLMPGLYGREAAEHQMVYRDWIPSWLLWAVPPALKVVNTLSAGQYFGAVKILPNTDHFTTVKPHSINHPSHQFLVDFWLDFHRQIERRAPVDTVHRGELPPVAEPKAKFLDAASLQRHTFAAISQEPNTSGSVFVYVEIQDLDGFNFQFNGALKSMLEDPLVLAVPAWTATLKERRIRFQKLDAELLTRLLDVLGELTFEAYVAFTSSDSVEHLAALVSNLTFVRLRGLDRASVEIALAETSGSRKAIISAAIQSAIRRIGRVDGKSISLALNNHGTADPPKVVAQLIADIVHTRITKPNSPMARAFMRIHPTKVRLIYDFDRGRYFSRRRPFTAES